MAEIRREVVKSSGRIPEKNKPIAFVRFDYLTPSAADPETKKSETYAFDEETAMELAALLLRLCREFKKTK